ncbi:MAG: EAL domain-containing protein, partial [Rudaea sp.]
LVANRLDVEYQPVIELASGRCVGSEALARWNRENGEPVSPVAFIPIAEEARLIHDLTQTVLKIAMDDMRRVHLEFPDVTVNVNLSPEDLRDERTGHALIQSLAASKLSAGAVKLEITERALLNSEVSRALIREFRQRGHQVAIDDFGTGYCSLSYLQTFDLDVLKIDKSFVDAIGTEAATSQVIVHVIEMAKTLNLEIIAEGVETLEQAEWLVKHGVPYGQGFLFSKPLSIGEYIDFLRAQERQVVAESHHDW